jgi:hypothetical protein
MLSRDGDGRRRLDSADPQSKLKLSLQAPSVVSKIDFLVAFTEFQFLSLPVWHLGTHLPRKRTTMKLCKTVAVSTVIASVGAFVPSTIPPIARQMAFTNTRQMTAVPESDQGMVGQSAMPVASAYDRIGVTKEELAIGVDATEFLQWIGSKQELADKFVRDNKGMTEERALSEVSKFMMDAEMVNAYIKFERDKVENPPDRKAEAEQTLSDPRTIATYAAWLIGGGSFGYIRKNIIEPKFASGEWEEIHIQLPTPPGFVEPQAVQSVASAIHHAMDGSGEGGLDNIMSSLV